MILATRSLSLGAMPWDTQPACLRAAGNQRDVAVCRHRRERCQRARGVTIMVTPLGVVKRTCWRGRCESRVN